jgi:hypothetical protein
MPGSPHSFMHLQHWRPGLLSENARVTVTAKTATL